MQIGAILMFKSYDATIKYKRDHANPEINMLTPRVIQHPDLGKQFYLARRIMGEIHAVTYGNVIRNVGAI